MTWDGYWLPHLVDWSASILLGAALIPLLRSMLRKAARQAAGHAQDAAAAATDATASAEAAAASERRLTGVEASVGGILDGVSASLGLRALDDLRFRSIEAELGKGKHARE